MILTITMITSITIEGMQTVSRMLFVAGAILCILAVILFIRFDIRNIWGLLMSHKSRNASQIIEEKGDIKPTASKELETDATYPKTLPLENQTSNFKILQDKTCIHTNIQII